jgi:hypothetical protein
MPNLAGDMPFRVLSLINFEDFRVRVGAGVWQSWAMAVGIDCMLISVALAQLTAPPAVKRDIALVARCMEPGTLVMSAGLNAQADRSHPHDDHGAGEISGLPFSMTLTPKALTPFLVQASCMIPAGTWNESPAFSCLSGWPSILSVRSPSRMYAFSTPG